jgi:hypothetical protein
MLARMYKKRLAGYAALGYTVIKELKTRTISVIAVADALFARSRRSATT